MPEGREYRQDAELAEIPPATAHPMDMSAEHGHDRTDRRLARPLCRILCRSRRCVSPARAVGDGPADRLECAGTAYEGGRFVVDIGSSPPPLFPGLGRLPFHKFPAAHLPYIDGVQWHRRDIRSNRSR
jgi:hypothetical protein